MYYLSIKLNPKLYFEKIIDRYLAFLKEKDRVMFLSLIIVSFLLYKLTFPCHSDTGPISIMNKKSGIFCTNLASSKLHTFS